MIRTLVRYMCVSVSVNRTIMMMDKVKVNINKVIV